MSRLVFGEAPPESVVVVRPHKPTPCELPHFTRGGDPRGVAGLVYRLADGKTRVLCRMHGKAAYGL